MSQRLDGLHRNQNLNKMQLRNIQNQIKQKIEQAQLNNVINLEEMGLTEEAVQELQSQIVGDDQIVEGSQSSQIDRKVVQFLITKLDQVHDETDLAKLDQIQEVYAANK